MAEVMEVSDPILSSYAELAKVWATNGGDWLNAIRGEAIERFRELGFPDTRQEDWKYTNVSPVRKAGFKLPSASKTVRQDDIAPFLLDGLKCARLVVVDGRFSEELSTIPGLPPGVCLGGLAEAISRGSAPADASPRRRLTKRATFQDRPFVALNTAFLQDGVYVFVPRGTALPLPVHLLFVSTATGRAEPVVSHPRCLIALEDTTELTVIEDYVFCGRPGGSAPYLTNAVTEIDMGAGALLDYYKLERESDRAYHFAALAVRQSRDSRFTSHTVCVGGGLVRNNIDVELDGEGIDCTLNGLTVIGGKQHVDNQTRIVHAKPRCHSWEIYKNILSDRATGVFNGKIYVAQDAQKTDAKQTNKTLLLSARAVMNSKPELEIYADDVKCTHGATVGELDRESLFYLLSRGIDRETARSLLTYAFASEVVDNIKVRPLRAAIQKMLFSKLPQEFALEVS